MCPLNTEWLLSHTRLAYKGLTVEHKKAVSPISMSVDKKHNSVLWKRSPHEAGGHYIKNNLCPAGLYLLD